uniref:Armadillo repeat-containing protein 8 n=1 Tax=Amphora coffeiformis TaxID=265554 RepID=A0A7S3LBJ6_9STRA
MADDDFFRYLGDGQYDKVFPLAQTVMAVATNAHIDLPPGLLAGIVDALSRAKDRGDLKGLLNFLVSSIAAAGVAMPIPPKTIQILLNLFRTHQHDLDLCDGILSTMCHILFLSPPEIDPIFVARSILDYVLSPSVTDDTQEKASIALWALLAKNACDDQDLLSRIYSYIVKVFERFVGETSEAFDSSLVEVTCGVLCAVASLVRLAPFAIAQEDVDTIVSIVYLSMEMEGSPEIPCLVLESLYHFCVVNESVLIQCGAIVVVADAVQKFNRDPAVLEAGFAVLAQLASTENVHINLSIVFSDGVDSLLHGMNQFPGEDGLQLEGCKAFSHLSIEGETRMVICEQGGVALIVRSVAEHEGNEVLVEYGCSALLNLTSDAPDDAVNDTGIIHCIVSLMERYQRTPSVRRNCLGILQNISMKGAHAKDAIARSGGLVSVIQTMEQQIDSPDVLERAFTTLWSLAVLAENRERIRCAGGIEHAIQAMLSFVEYEGVQQQACGCICTLAMDPVVRKTIKSAGGSLALLYAMRVHFTSIDVQSEAARALSVMYGVEGGDRTLQPSAEELDAVLMAMRRFDGNQTIQDRGLAALSSLLACSSTPQTFSSEFDEIRRLARKVSARFPGLAAEAAHVESLAL